VYTRTLLLISFLLLFAVGPTLAQSSPCVAESEQTTCTIQFDPNDTQGVYDFSQSLGGYLVVQFDTILTTFDLTVMVATTTNPPLDGTEFPPGTVCVQYQGEGPGTCVQYNFSGSGTVGNGPNGVPVKNIDYKGLISLTLSYFTDPSFTVHTPAFGHAPGDITTFTENILTSYSDDTVCGVACDPTMGGKTPGLSSIIALDEPLTATDSACNLTLTPTNVSSGQKPQIEVTFQLLGGNTCPGTGAPTRDKTATISVSTIDQNSGNLVFPALKNVEGNKFHWDNKNALNEYDISLDGLANGKYTATVFSTKFSPVSANFCINNGAVVTCLP